MKIIFSHIDKILKSSSSFSIDYITKNSCVLDSNFFFWMSLIGCHTSESKGQEYIRVVGFGPTKISMCPCPFVEDVQCKFTRQGQVYCCCFIVRSCIGLMLDGCCCWWVKKSSTTSFSFLPLTRMVQALTDVNNRPGTHVGKEVKGKQTDGHVT